LQAVQKLKNAAGFDLAGYQSPQAEWVRGCSTIRRLAPRSKILFLSGSHPDIVELLLAGGSGFVSKMDVRKTVDQY